MFDLSDIQQNVMYSAQENLGAIFHTYELQVSQDVVEAIQGVITGLFTPNYPKARAIKKTPDDFGNYDNERGIFNVIPSTIQSRRITDTLVVYCLGNDNLQNRLIDTIISVGKYRFKNVIFVTSKWDVSALSGNNVKRLQDLFEFKQKGTMFCFILVSIGGISGIPVV